MGRGSNHAHRFGETGASELRDALRQIGRDDCVLEFPDDLSFGPIAPSNPAFRAQWIATELGDGDWQEIIPLVERFWTDAMSGNDRHVVWFSRRAVRDHCGFLDYLWRVGDRPCDVVDLTEVLVRVRGDDSAIRAARRAVCIGLLDSYQFIEGNLLSLAAPLAAETRAAYRAQWQRLRAENAPLRIVTDDQRLVSEPLTHFDEALLAQMQPRFLKAARIIGRVLAEKWYSDICEVGDFFLSCRLLALARSGVIEGKGDLRRIAFSEVRLAPPRQT